MPQFRKKPVVVEAEQFTQERVDRADLPFQKQSVCCYTGELGWHVYTREGPLHISDGDWIIKGVQGEFYPCKPEIFAATYEPADVLEPLAPPAKEG